MSGSINPIYAGVAPPTALQRGGLAAVTVNGEALDVTDVTYRANRVKRETKVTQNGIAGYTVNPMPGMISFTVVDAGNMTVGNFNALDNASVVLNLANGKTVIGDGMWTVDDQEVNTSDGTFKVTFEGVVVTEIVV